MANTQEQKAEYNRAYYLAHSTRPRRVPGAERQSKLCRKCGIEKPRAEYFIRKESKFAGHLSAYCKACSSAKNRAHRDRDPSAYRRVEWPSKLKCYYGITVDDYTRMLADQGGGCALCGSTNPMAGSRAYPKTQRTAFDVDHCHRTGRVRGLLCTRCNRLVGLANDSADTARKLVQYLTKGE